MQGWILAVVLFLVALIGVTAATQSEESTQQAQVTMTESVVGSMKVYRNAVTAFAKSNPTFNGEATIAQLNLPSWFTPMAGVRNYVSGGKGYVYYNAPEQDAGQAYRLLKETDNSALVGVNRSGSLSNPLAGSTSITLPAAIPDGAVVIAPMAVSITASTCVVPTPATETDTTTETRTVA